MTLSRFQHGILATPNVGGSRLIDIWNSENIFFVDGDNGDSGNAGKDPGDSVALISTAVANAARCGTIYVRPRTTAASAQAYYIENITIPLTKPQLSIIGCAQDMDRPYLGPAVKTTTVGAGTPVLTIKANSFLTEGMEWTGTSQTADTASIIVTVGDGTLGRASGFTIRNCTLRNAKGHLISGGGAIYLDTAIYMKIENCLFRDNPNSIAIRSVYAAINSCIIAGNIFSGATSVRDVDIFCNADAGSGMDVIGNIFSSALPNHGVVNKYISFASGPAGVVAENCFAYPGTNGEALFAATGTIGNIPTTMASVHNYFESTTEGQGIINR
jgi:hypothetical protein